MATKKILGDYFFIILTLVIGLITTITLGFAINRAENASIHQEFQSHAQERFAFIQDSITSNIAVAESVAAFFRASDYVSKEEFSTYVADMIKNYPFLRSVIWLPYVKDEDRADFEDTGKRIYSNFQIQEMNTEDKLVRSQTRPEYFPLYYAEPLKYPNTLGFDYFSEQLRREALIGARDSNAVHATAELKLLATENHGIIFFAPIIKVGRKDNATLEGFVGSVAPLDNIVNAALQKLTPVGVNIVISDLSSSTPSHPIYIKPSRLNLMTEQEVINQYESPLSEKLTKDIDVAGRKWKITIMPINSYYKFGFGSTPLAIFIGGFAFTIMLAYYMFSRLREKERILKQVTERTEELSHTQKELGLILNSTKDGVIGIDKNAKITFSNIMAPLMLGYKKNDIIGQSFLDLILQLKPADMEKNPVVQALKTDVENKAVDNELFWRRNNKPMKVEYTASSLVENNQISGAVVVFRDITDRKTYEENLQQMAMYDQLTQLANRRQFIELLRKSISRAQRTKNKVGVVYLDLNDFKLINDTKGHAAGDSALQEFSARVKSSVREYDTVGRLGGDEFAIIADNINSAEECEVIIKRIIKSFDKPFIVDGTEFKLSASIGVAIYPDHAKTLDDLIAAADSAMYEAKKTKSKTPIFNNNNGKKS